MGEGYDKIGILNEDNAIISLPTSTRSLRDITGKGEETTQYCKYERVVLDVTGHDETNVALITQLEKGFSTKAVCGEEHLRSAEASWRTFKGVSNARHDQTMLNLLMLRDAVERKLYEQAQSNEDWFDQQRNDISNRLRDQERGICKFKVASVESLGEMSKALTQLTERVDTLTSDMEAHEELLDEVIHLRKENDTLRAEKAVLRERLARSAAATLQIAMDDDVSLHRN